MFKRSRILPKRSERRAQVIRMPDYLLDCLTRELLEVPGISTLLFDLTNKPPGTIEWE